MSSTPKSVPFPSRRNLSLSLAAAVALVLGSQGAQADILTWDANTGTAGVQDGIGTWSMTGNNWWNGTGNVSWNTGTPNSVIFGGGTGSGTAGKITLGSDITVGNITFAATGGGTYTIEGSKTLTLSNTTIDGTANATISASLAGTGLTITNTGAAGTSRTLTLSGNNTYSGSTVIGATTGGTQIVQLTSANALGNSNQITVKNGSALLIGKSMTIGSDKTLAIAGSGFSNQGALSIASDTTATWAGAISLDSGARVGAMPRSTLTLSGPIQNGASNILSISAFGTDSDTGVVIISGTQNTYTGGTNIVRGILRLGAHDALPKGTLLDVDNATAPEDSTFDLSGFNQTVGGLQRSNTTGGGSFITNTGTSAATLTVNNASSVNTIYSGIIRDGTSPLALTKSNTGTLTLSGGTSYSGATTVNGGTLKLTGTNTGSTPLTVNGGTLEFSGSNTGSTPITVNGGTATLSGTNTANTALTVNAGTLAVSGSNTSNAAVTVNGGTLQVSGPAGALGSTNLQLNGGTFTVDNTGASNDNSTRLADTSTFALRGGTFLYKGSDQSGINSSETIGSFSLDAGRSTITVQRGSTNTATLTAGQLNRATGGGTALINGVNLGSSASGDASRLMLTTAPMLVGEGNTATNKGIVPFLLGEVDTTTGAVTATGVPNTFVTYDSTTGLRPLSVTEFEGNVVAGANVRISEAPTGSIGSNTINSLIVTGVTLTLSGTLENTSGAFLFTSGTTNIGGGTLALGGREAIMTVSGTTAVVASKITGTNGLSLFGPGTLGLGSTVSDYTGQTMLHSGTIVPQVSSSGSGESLVGPFGRSTIVFAGSQLRSSSASSATPTTIGNSVILQADTTVISGGGNDLIFSGPVTLAGGTRTLTNSTDKNTTFSGTISGNQGYGLTVAGSGTGSLILSGNNSYTGPTLVRSSTLKVSGSIATSSALAVQNSGSLLLSGSNPAGPGRIGDDTPVTLGSSTGTGPAKFTIDNSTTSQSSAVFHETVGTLTLLNNSILDLGTGNFGTHLYFADSSSNGWSGNLNIQNWNQGTDRLYFGSNQSGLTSAQLSQVVFYDTGGNEWIRGGMLLGDGELVPVPEPSTVFCGVAMLGLVCWRERRRFFRKLALES